MSFFDEDDEPLRTTSRTRSKPRPRRGSPAGVSRADSQSVLVRRMVFVIVVLIFVIFAGALIRSCSSNRHKDALRQYNQDVSGIAQSSAQLGEQFFKQLSQGANQSPQALQGQINTYRAQADTQLTQAKALNTPGEMSQAQQSFLIALELRRDGLQTIASEIRTALGDSGNQADQAIKAIAGQMQYFNASDVLYKARVTPFIKAGLKDAGGGEPSSSRFMSDISWLAPQFVASKLGQQISTAQSGGSSSRQPTGPGLHGTGLNSTSYGDTTLSPTATNRLTYVSGQAFTVSFTNQGDNEEFNVKVTVRIIETASNKTVVTLNKTVPSIVKGQKATVSLPLNRTPPTGAAVVVRVDVAPVPGEKKTDNNRSEYPTLFVAG